jgi:two-component system chemotaxis sensor kinase CheA
VAHAAENVLGKFRDGVLEVTPEAVTLILASLDRIKDLLGALEETEAEPEGDDGPLIAQLDTMAEGGGAEPAEQPIAEAEVVEEEVALEEGDARPNSIDRASRS